MSGYEPCVTNHTAVIYDRGGMTRLAGGLIRRPERVQWSRDRDGVSEASVLITGKACSEQREMLNRVASKRHELVIFRGQERVWEGPIFRISDEGNRVEIFAKDVIAYLFGTPLTQDWDNTNAGNGSTTVTGRLGGIITYEMTTGRMGRALGGEIVPIPAWESLSPPANVVPHLQIHHNVNEARTSAKTTPFQMTVGEHLAAVARTSGIDYTAVGRAIHIWDTSRNLGRTRQLSEADFYGPVIVTEYGADHTQIAYVATQEAAYGEAVNTEHMDFYGPWSTVYTAYNEEGTQAPSEPELNSQAARNTSGRSPVPFEVRIPDNSSVRLSDSLPINMLVPGVQVPLVATLNARNFSQLQKIDFLRVTETAEGENVQLTLTPATREDSNEPED